MPGRIRRRLIGEHEKVWSEKTLHFLRKLLNIFTIRFSRCWHSCSNVAWHSKEAESITGH